MEFFSFTPKIDLPLALVSLIGFLVNYQLWAKSGDPELNVDLISRLPQARIRIVFFFAGLLLVCWLVNLGLWTILAALVLLGLFFSLFIGNSMAPEFMFVATAGVLREWSFGFPTLILTPSPQSDTHSSKLKSELIGVVGITTSPLRPSGDIKIDEQELLAISDDGRLIEVGTQIVVTGIRNGRASVRIADDQND